MNELQKHLAEERGKASSSTQGLTEAKNRIESLVSKISELESSNLKLTQRISDLAQEMEDQNSSHKSQVMNYNFVIFTRLNYLEVNKWFILVDP